MIVSIMNYKKVLQSANMKKNGCFSVNKNLIFRGMDAPLFSINNRLFSEVLKNSNV
jgi:hypothetical protein